MKVFPAGFALSTALTAATLILAAPLTRAQDLLFGAYDPRQQEILWNEAINFQSNGQHSEAIDKLKRAAHLSRINDGLNATSQLPYLRAEIASLQRQLGVTTVYVTHDQVEALTMGDRVAVLKDGVLQQVDTPKVLYASPTNAFVAGFIGSPSMNLFEGLLSEDKIHFGDAAISISKAVYCRLPGLRAYKGRNVIFGVRPEDLYDGTLESGAKFPTIPAQVRSMEELGAEHIVHFAIDATRVDSGDPDAVKELNSRSNLVARIEARSTMKPGTDIHLAIDADRLHFFHPETHMAI